VDTRRLVIAHRGASGVAPEHTQGAFVAALDGGADVLEVDVVCTVDGVLVARHDWGLTLTTDAEDHAELEHAHVLRDGRQGRVADYWVDHLSWEELTTLRCRERWPSIRPVSAAHNGRWPLMSLPEVLALAEAQALARSRPVGVAVELKDVRAALQTRGLDVLAALRDALEAAGAPSPRVPVWVMAFEADVVDELRQRQQHHEIVRTPLVQLVETTAPRSRTDWEAIAARADVLGIAHDLALASAGASAGPEVLAQARAVGLEVWTWTLRVENAFLPARLRRGRGPASPGALDVQVAEAVRHGVTGLVGDQPALLREMLSVVC
jgi:glycerophosphoryl diester phosphodiesterase